LTALHPAAASDQPATPSPVLATTVEVRCPLCTGRAVLVVNWRDYGAGLLAATGSTVPHECRRWTAPADPPTPPLW
jgi:hypothetical protein